VPPSLGVSRFGGGGTGAWNVIVSGTVGEGRPKVPSAATAKTRTNRGVSKPSSGACALVVDSCTSTRRVPGVNAELDDICSR